ncbi:MAG: hypothetical protein K6G64_00485 [Eubacterium sp.]|nr:hypothetical protein [Eubacterium sp.]
MNKQVKKEQKKEKFGTVKNWAKKHKKGLVSVGVGGTAAVILGIIMKKNGGSIFFEKILVDGKNLNEFSKEGLIGECEECGTEFDLENTREEFEIENSQFSYDNFRRILCKDCAGEVFEQDKEGEYFEECERCGCKFDPIQASREFPSVINNVTDQRYWDTCHDDILCLDCAIEKEEEYYEEDCEDLSDYDAAEIWASNGKDEDYMFGYTEEELENALNKW